MVIPPGREQQVARLLRPLAGGFLGLRHAGTRIQGGEIQVLLEQDAAGQQPNVRCTGPDWVTPPGALLIQRASSHRPAQLAPRWSQGEVTRGGIRLAWFLCGDASGPGPEPRGEAIELAAAMAASHRGGIWQHRLADATGRLDVGLLSPVVHRLGVEPGHVLLLSLGLGLLVCVGVGLALRPGPAPPAPAPAGRWPHRATLVMVSLLLLGGVALRGYHAAHLPLDTDEVWALPGQTPVFNADHDAWVHPPLHRATQRAYLRLSGWTEGDPLLALRLPSLCAGALALLFLALALLQGGRSPWALIPFALVACSPDIARQCALARPYPLAAMLVMLAALALCVEPSHGRTSGRLHQGLRWTVCLLAFTLAAWTDILAGMAAWLLVAVALLPGRLALPMSPRLRPVALLLAVAPVLALAPGGAKALREQVRPGPNGEVSRSRPGSEQPQGPDLRPERDPAGRGAVARRIFGFGLLGQAGAGLALPVMGALALACLTLVALRRRSLLGLVPPLLVLLLFVIASAVSLRPRNMLFLPHLMALAVGMQIQAAGGAPSSRKG